MNSKILLISISLVITIRMTSSLLWNDTVWGLKKFYFTRQLIVLHIFKDGKQM